MIAHYKYLLLDTNVSRHSGTTLSNQSFFGLKALTFQPQHSIFWVAGILCAIVATSLYCMPISGEPREWAIYLLLGTLLPVLVLSATLAQNILSMRWPQSASVTIVGQYTLAALFIAGATATLSNRASWPLLALASLQLIAERIAQTESGTMAPLGKVDIVRILPQALLILFAWLACSTLMWWQPLQDWLSSSAAVAVLVAAFSIAVGASGLSNESRILRREGPDLVDLLALLVFGLGSSITRFDFHDVSFITGSIALVKSGGWLLWNVPSQYGFLNILISALIPLDDPWACLHIVSSVTLFFSASISYFLLRSIAIGTLPRIAATIVVMAAVLMLPGWAPGLTGANFAPMISAFRFFWVYVLILVIACLVRPSLVPKLSSRTATRYLPVLGTLSWLAGSLWSIESAIYCSATWLPAIVLFKILQHQGAGDSPGAIARATIQSLSIQLAALTVVVVSISIGYWVMLDSLPDWYAYVEFALTYGGGFGSLPIQPTGSVWWLLLGLCSLWSAIPPLYRADRAALPLAVAAAIAVWATHSYFVGRSHENNVTNLTPILLLGLIASLHALRHRCPDCARWNSSILVPFMTMILVATFGNFPHLMEYKSSLMDSHSPSSASFRLPQIRPEIRDFLRENGIKEGDALAYVGNTLLPEPMGATISYWLPIAPSTQISLLDPVRQRLYYRRFLERQTDCGWLLQPLGLATAPTGVAQTGLGEKMFEPSRFPEFQARCTLESRVDNGELRLERYRAKNTR